MEDRDDLLECPRPFGSSAAPGADIVHACTPRPADERGFPVLDRGRRDIFERRIAHPLLRRERIALVEDECRHVPRLLFGDETRELADGGKVEPRARYGIEAVPELWRRRIASQVPARDVVELVEAA